MSLRKLVYQFTIYIVCRNSVTRQGTALKGQENSAKIRYEQRKHLFGLLKLSDTIQEWGLRLIYHNIMHSLWYRAINTQNWYRLHTSAI